MILYLKSRNYLDFIIPNREWFNCRKKNFFEMTVNWRQLFDKTISKMNFRFLICKSHWYIKAEIKYHVDQTLEHFNGFSKHYQMLFDYIQRTIDFHCEYHDTFTLKNTQSNDQVF